MTHTQALRKSEQLINEINNLQSKIYNFHTDMEDSDKVNWSEDSKDLVHSSGFELDEARARMEEFISNIKYYSRFDKHVEK